MQGKVEISCVNTAKLPRLGSEETDALLRRAKDGDRAAREALIEGNLRLVLSVIQKFIGRGENADDLFQVGCVGLIKAIDNFDPSHAVKFSTYGVPMTVPMSKTPQSQAVIFCDNKVTGGFVRIWVIMDSTLRRIDSPLRRIGSLLRRIDSLRRRVDSLRRRVPFSGWIFIVNGTITLADKDGKDVKSGDEVAANSEITVIVTPTVETLTVKSVSYTAEGATEATEITAVEGVYSFTMPTANVTVTAEFETIKAAITWTVPASADVNDANISYTIAYTLDGESKTETDTAKVTEVDLGTDITVTVKVSAGGSNLTDNFNITVNGEANGSKVTASADPTAIEIKAAELETLKITLGSDLSVTEVYVDGTLATATGTNTEGASIYTVVEGKPVIIVSDELGSGTLLVKKSSGTGDSKTFEVADVLASGSDAVLTGKAGATFEMGSESLSLTKAKNIISGAIAIHYDGVTLTDTNNKALAKDEANKTWYVQSGATITTDVEAIEAAKETDITATGAPAKSHTINGEIWLKAGVTVTVNGASASLAKVEASDTIAAGTLGTAATSYVATGAKLKVSAVAGKGNAVIQTATPKDNAPTYLSSSTNVADTEVTIDKAYTFTGATQIIMEEGITGTLNAANDVKSEDYVQQSTPITTVKTTTAGTALILNVAENAGTTAIKKPTSDTVKDVAKSGALPTAVPTNGTLTVVPAIEVTAASGITLGYGLTGDYDATNNKGVEVNNPSSGVYMIPGTEIYVLSNDNQSKVIANPDISLSDPVLITGNTKYIETGTLGVKDVTLSEETMSDDYVTFISAADSKVTAKVDLTDAQGFTTVAAIDTAVKAINADLADKYGSTMVSVKISGGSATIMDDTAVNAAFDSLTSGTEVTIEWGYFKVTAAGGETTATNIKSGATSLTVATAGASYKVVMAANTGITPNTTETTKFYTASDKTLTIDAVTGDLTITLAYTVTVGTDVYYRDADTALSGAVFTDKNNTTLSTGAAASLNGAKIKMITGGTDTGEIIDDLDGKPTANVTLKAVYTVTVNGDVYNRDADTTLANAVSEDDDTTKVSDILTSAKIKMSDGTAANDEVGDKAAILALTPAKNVTLAAVYSVTVGEKVYYCEADAALKTAELLDGTGDLSTTTAASLGGSVIKMTGTGGTSYIADLEGVATENVELTGGYWTVTITTTAPTVASGGSYAALTATKGTDAEADEQNTNVFYVKAATGTVTVGLTCSTAPTGSGDKDVITLKSGANACTITIGSNVSTDATDGATWEVANDASGDALTATATITNVTGDNSISASGAHE